MSFSQHKNTVRKKDGQIVVGDSQSKIRIDGMIDARGNLNIQNPFSSPTSRDENRSFKVLHTDGTKYEWRNEHPHSLFSSDSPRGLDFVFVNSSQAFMKEDKVILNPCGATRETGVISHLLGTKVYLDNTTSYDHYQGETLVKI